MNRFFNWLNASANNSASLEEKNSTGSLIAFHSAGNAIWSTLDGREQSSAAFAKIQLFIGV